MIVRRQRALRESAGLRFLPAALDLVLVPPEGGDPEPAIACRFDEQLNLLASRRGLEQKGGIVVGVQTLPGDTVLPEQSLRSAGEAEQHGFSGHFPRNGPGDAEPGRGPNRPPSPADLDRSV